MGELRNDSNSATHFLENSAAHFVDTRCERRHMRLRWRPAMLMFSVVMVLVGGSPPDDPTNFPTLAPISSASDAPTSASPRTSTDHPTITTSPTESPTSTSPTESPTSQFPTTLTPTRNPMTPTPTRSPTITQNPSTSPITNHPATQSPTHTPSTSSPTGAPTPLPTVCAFIPVNTNADASNRYMNLTLCTGIPGYTDYGDRESTCKIHSSTLTTTSCGALCPSWNPGLRCMYTLNDAFSTASNSWCGVEGNYSCSLALYTKVCVCAFQIPTASPTVYPTNTPTTYPTNIPTTNQTNTPTTYPTNIPTTNPTNTPTTNPTNTPTTNPTYTPTINPTNNPTNIPTTNPTNTPTTNPTNTPTTNPTNTPTTNPTNNPTNIPTTNPTNTPTTNPTNTPTTNPTSAPTNTPTQAPATGTPTQAPATGTPTQAPATSIPTTTPTVSPTNNPTTNPTIVSPPELSLVGTREISSCGQVQISASVSVFSPEAVSYLWKVNGTAISTATTGLLTIKYSEIQTLLGASTLADGEVFLFSVTASQTLTTGTQRSLVNLWPVVFRNTIQPIVRGFVEDSTSSTLPGNTIFYTVNPAELNSVRISILHDACVDTNALSTFTLSVTWTVSYRSPSGSQLYAISLDSSINSGGLSLSLPSGVLVPGFWHVVVAELRGFESLYGFSAVSKEVLVQALNVPVVAAVSVSEQVVASATSDFVVDALASMDPAKAPALHSFTWDCADLTPTSNVTANTTINTTACASNFLHIREDGAKAIIPAGMATPGRQLRMTVTFTVTLDGIEESSAVPSHIREDTATIFVTFSGLMLPTVSVRSFDELVDVGSSPPAIPAGQGVRLIANAVAHPSSPSSSRQLRQSDPLIYTWTEASGALASVPPQARISPLKTESLVLTSTALRRGQSYTFTITVEDPATSTAASASIAVQLLSSPTISSLTVTPSSGETLTTRFQLACTAYGGVAPLDFQFLGKLSYELSSKIVRDWGSSSSHSMSIATTGDYQIAVQVRDLYGSSVRVWLSSSISVVDPPKTTCTEFDALRRYGITLLESAGVPVSLVVSGATAQKSAGAVLDVFRLLLRFNAFEGLLDFTGQLIDYEKSRNVFKTLDINCLQDTSYTSGEAYFSGLMKLLLDCLEAAINAEGPRLVELLIQSTNSLFNLSSSVNTLTSTSSSESEALQSQKSRLLNQLLPLAITQNLLVDSQRSTSLDFANQLAESISQLADGFNTLPSNNSEAQRSASSLARGLLNATAATAVPGEPPKRFNTKAFNASSVAFRGGFNTKDSDIGVSVPILSSSDQDLRLIIISWRENLPVEATSLGRSEGESLASVVHDVTLINSSDGSNAIIPSASTIASANSNTNINTDGRIHLEIPIVTEALKGTSESSFSCAFWDPVNKAWKNKGCVLLEIVNGSGVCECNHLTEFAIMHDSKNEKKLNSLHMMVSMLVWCVLAAGVLIFASRQSVVLIQARKHREWVSLVHYSIAAEMLFRIVSCLLLSGIMTDFSITTTQPFLVVCITSLPYTFSFWTSSLVAFQWLSTAYNSRLRINPFQENKFTYYIANGCTVVIVWTLLALMWLTDLNHMELVGPLVIATMCLLLMCSYLVAGFTIEKKLKKAFKLSVAGVGSQKEKAQINKATGVRNIAVLVSACFACSTVLWILTGLFATKAAIVEIVIPIFVVVDIMTVIILLNIYRPAVRAALHSISGSRKNRSGHRSHPDSRSNHGRGRGTNSRSASRKGSMYRSNYRRSLSQNLVQSQRIRKVSHTRTRLHHKGYPGDSPGPNLRKMRLQTSQADSKESEALTAIHSVGESKQGSKMLKTSESYLRSITNVNATDVNVSGITMDSRGVSRLGSGLSGLNSGGKIKRVDSSEGVMNLTVMRSKSDPRVSQMRDSTPTGGTPTSKTVNVVISVPKVPSLSKPGSPSRRISSVKDGEQVTPVQASYQLTTPTTVRSTKVASMSTTSPIALHSTISINSADANMHMTSRSRGRNSPLTHCPGTPGSGDAFEMLTKS